MRSFAFALVACVVAGAGCHHGGDGETTDVEGGGKATGNGHAPVGSPARLLEEARADAQSGELDAADQAYAQAYTAEPKLATLAERVDFLVHAGRAGKAVVAAKAYFDANPTDANGYALYALALIGAGRGSDALAIADRLLKLKPDDPVGHDRRGRALILDGREDEGVDELRKARDADPKDPSFHIQLGLALDKVGKIDEAALEFRTAIKTSTEATETDADVYLGMALREQAEYDESKTYLQKALARDPHNGRAYFELGRLANAQKQQADAETDFAKAVEYSPNESLYWYAYGEIYRVQERDDAAINAYRKALELDPPYPKAMTKLGTLLVERKQYDDAEQVLIPATRKAPKEAANYLQLGVLYAAQGKRERAIDNLKKFRELAAKSDPDLATARDLLAKLGAR